MDTAGFSFADTNEQAQDNSDAYNMTSSNPAAPPLPDNVLTNRANRADFALGDKSPGVPALKDAFKNGAEPIVRQTAAAQADIDFRKERLQQIRDMTSKGVPLTEFDVDTLMAAGNVPEANPDTVIEDKFAKQMVAYGVAGDPANNSVMQKAFDKEPDVSRENVMKTQNVVSRKHIAQGVLEEAQAAYDNLPWISLNDPNQQDKLGNLFQDIFSGGIASYVNQRNLLNSSPNSSWLPGSNKLEQIQYLYLLPHSQFKQALMSAAGPGSKLWKEAPSDALDFIKSAVQFSTSDAYVDNVMAVGNAAGMIPVGTGLKAIGMLRKGKEVAETANAVQGLRAAQEVLQGSPVPPVSQATTDARAGFNAATDVLNAPATPPAKTFYVPKEVATKTTYPTKDTSVVVPRNFSTQIGPDGKPRVFNEDGVEVQLGTTPEVGHFPVEITPPTGKTTFTNREGTFEHTTENGQSIVNGKNTIYVNKADSEKLSQVLDETKNSQILSDDKGYFVGDLDKGGKEIKGSRVSFKRVSNQPSQGAYPIHLSEGNDKQAFEDFGSRITRLDTDTTPGVKLGPQVVSNEDFQTRKALADIAKSQGETDPQDVMSKMGKHEDAATVGAQRLITDRLGEVVHDADPEAIRRQIPSIASPQTFFHNAASLSTGRAQALAEMAQKSSNELVAAILNPVRVERLTPEALSRAIEIAKTQVKEKYNRASDAILDQVTHWDGASNTYHIETRVGKKDKTLFDTYENAKHWKDFQYRFGPSATVEQEGTQFYLRHIQHIDETQSGVRNSLIVSGNETPRGFWNTLVNAVTGRVLGFGDLGPSLRSSAYTASAFQRNNRVAATHAPSLMKNAIESVAKDIGVLSKTERHEMQQILEHNRDFMHPDGTRGQFYKSATEFEIAFNSKFGKLPTDKQILAYDQFTRLSDLDWTLRALDLYRDKVRIGIRNYKVNFKGTDGAGLPTSADSDWFHAKLVKDFDPVNTQNANVYILPEGKFSTKFDVKDLKDVNEKLKSGEYQILQIYNPREKPLKELTGVKDDIHFVVTDKYKDRHVQLGEGIEYRPGGHVIYQDPYFMKVPMIGKGTAGRDTHFGDTTLKSFATEREGNEWVKKYNTAREFLRANDEAGLQAYIDAGHLPETLQEFKKWYTSGGLDLQAEHPFVLTTSGRDTFQSSEELARQYPGLKDQYSSYNLAQTQGTAYLAERDQQLNTIANKGTEANPIYTNVPSRLYDPYTALQKGMQQIVRSRWMSDYKTSAAESWVQEFGLLFDQSKLPIEKLRQNPTYWLYHAKGNLDPGVLKKNPELYTAAMVARHNIMNFVGARDEVGAAFEGLAAKMVSGIESVGGKDLAQFVGETALPKITDASTYARAWAFNAVDGMFNPVQIIQQGMGMTHAIAISPVNGIKGSVASMLARAYSRTENAAILDDMANKAARLGWKKEEFVEAYNAWKNTGVHNIGGEQALLSQQADPKLYRDGFHTFVDKGQMFFKAGESWTRDVSFFTAYRDWRAANPGKVLDNRNIGEVLNRFDTLSMNMTRASNAAYNEGLLSIPTQFWTWNARFAEQMLSFGAGKQLTLAEKARALTLYSAMYGIPSTLGGISMGIIPGFNYGDIRQYALANNLPVSEKWYQALSEGLPTVLLNMLSGHDTSLHRFSPDANQITDIVNGKKSIAEILGGASGTFVAQVAQTVWPFMTYAMSGFKKDGGFPLKWNDVSNLLENISSFNNAEKAWVGLSLGRYNSKTEGYVGDVDTFESAMLGLGLNPQRVQDTYTRLDYEKGRKSAQAKLQKKIAEDWKIALAAGERGDYQTMSEYMTRVNTWTQMGNFTAEEEVKNFQQAAQGVNTSLIDSVNERWLKNLPQINSVDRLKEYYDNMQKQK